MWKIRTDRSARLFVFFLLKDSFEEVASPRCPVLFRVLRRSYNHSKLKNTMISGVSKHKSTHGSTAGWPSVDELWASVEAHEQASK